MLWIKYCRDSKHKFFAKKMIKILESYLDFVNVRSAVIIKYRVKIGKR